ncbi:hypothetical protein JVT61DRAFT_3550 [Boletus reticuloceps]|uniref:Protein kinase domain-containing protein n=1 Tax=Boletus reticuloceps TaxID=495285 RepID=A0A8I2YR19_9AGAM|nr:hypothetical protein JVT61DRAFT_3550 [Boletus reticuloceps]
MTYRPSECSAKVQLSVCASFELSPMLGKGEVLREVEICAGDLRDTHCKCLISCASGRLKTSTVILFYPSEGGPTSPCSSLHITTERRPSHTSGGGSDHNVDFDWEESSELAQLTDQGHDALFRYCADPRKEFVADAIGYFEHALATCPPGHRCYAAVLCNLAGAHFVNCQIDHGPMRLSTSISCYRKALELRRDGHPDRPATLLHLAKVLLYHYGKLGYEEFPGELMELASEVQVCCSLDSHECRAADLALQTYALYKAISTGSLVDIDQLIPALRQTVQETPHGHLDRLQRLINLVSALWIRYELSGDLSDLDGSIAMHEETMRFDPCALHSCTYTQLLKEREMAALPGGSWKDALATAASFVVPRFSIYRALCERLETVDRTIDAAECFHRMTSELTHEIQDEEAKWISAFKSRCCGKLEDLADIEVNAQKYNAAISLYTTALSLDLTTPQDIFIKRSKAYIAKGSWKEAMNDANEVIMLDPSSPWGYERKYIASHEAGDYDNAADALELMLSKTSELAEEILQHCDPYIKTTTSPLHNTDEQESALESPEESTNYIIKLESRSPRAVSFGNINKCLCIGKMGRKEVAVKPLPFRFRMDISETARRELGIWRRLDHPNIVPFLGTITGFNTTSLVSLWMRNGTLESFLKKYVNIEVDHRLRLLLDIANGLRYLHTSVPDPIVHGDLNPVCNQTTSFSQLNLSQANVLLDGDYTACLLDFGRVSMEQEIPLVSRYLKATTVLPDNIRWNAPEQILSPPVSVHRTTQSDVYSFGCIALQASLSDIAFVSLLIQP